MHRRRIMIRRTAKVLATCRVILAAVFLTAVWLDPGHVPSAGGLVYTVLGLYLCWAICGAMIAWFSWWWEFRLARAFHAIDIAVFIAAIFLTEVGHSYASSPVVAFTAFLLIAAMSRWGQRAVLLTGMALCLTYAMAGGLFHGAGPANDLYQHDRRLINMIAMSVMIYMFGADVRVTRLAPMPETGGIPGKRRDRIMAGALLYAREALNAQGVAIAVAGAEEPWVDLYRDIDGCFAHERLGPDALTEDFDPDAVAALFDIPRNRRIMAFSDYHLTPVRGPFGHSLADQCAVATGILARLDSVGSPGQLLVWGIPDPCLDDLPVLASLAREVGQALDHEEMAVLAQSVAVAGVRTTVARDLHDTMAQVLAGTLFRLEALRRTIREGHDPDPEIVTMRDALRNEQRQLRAMIERLRRGNDSDGSGRTTDIVDELETVLAEIGGHWHIATSLESSCRPLPVSIGLAHELRLLVREAVANAVRHGGSNRVELVLDHRTRGLLQIAIGDNGTGFADSATMPRPRTISERIAGLGGDIRITSGPAGARLEIELPLPIAA